MTSSSKGALFEEEEGHQSQLQSHLKGERLFERRKFSDKAEGDGRTGEILDKSPVAILGYDVEWGRGNVGEGAREKKKGNYPPLQANESFRSWCPEGDVHHPRGRARRTPVPRRSPRRNNDEGEKASRIHQRREISWFARGGGEDPKGKKREAYRGDLVWGEEPP